MLVWKDKQPSFNFYCSSSLTIVACFNYTANPSSYSPMLSKTSSVFANDTCECSSAKSFVTVLLFLSAVEYSLEADSDIRKKGRSARATFTHGSKSGPVYKGIINIAGQEDRRCLIHELTIQVAALSIPTLWL